MKKKKTTTYLKNTGESYALNAKQKEEARNGEIEFLKQDNLILETIKIKNNLEAVSYALRGDLDPTSGPLRPFIDAEIVDKFLAEI